jgi:hypothetical protein
VIAGFGASFAAFTLTLSAVVQALRVLADSLRIAAVVLISLLGLGIIRTPCVGPIMASVISLALTRRIDGGSVYITLAYTLGTSLPMLAVMLGGRSLLTGVPALSRNTAAIQRVFGVLVILVAVAVGFGLDLRFQNALLRALPGYGAGLTAIEDTASVRRALDARASSAEDEGGAMMMAAKKPAA